MGGVGVIRSEAGPLQMARTRWLVSAAATLCTFTAGAQFGDLGAPTIDRPAFDQAPRQTERLPAFGALDENHDQAISQDEAAVSRVVSQLFVRADGNGNRELSRQEYLALQRGVRRR